MDIPAAPDHLTLPIAWMPSRRFEDGQPYEYQLTLPVGEVARLRRVAGKGWALTVASGGARPDADRGLFATVDDALLVLYAEYYPAQTLHSE
jgi:hypothetical protein